MGPSVYQTTQELLVEAAHSAVLAAVGPAQGGTESEVLALRASAALHSLLSAHGVDRRGRCRWCRRSWWPGRRGPTCTVYAKASYWLHQPLPVLLAHLADLDIDLPAPDPAEPDPDATRELIPIRAPGGSGPPTEPIPPATDLPDSDHGGTGADPDLPRSRRAPPAHDPPIDPHRGALIVGVGHAPCWL